MYRNAKEIEIVEDWRIVWWDLDNDKPYTMAIPGTLPKLEQRRIQNIYGKPVHRNCGGDLEVAREQEGCGSLEGRFSWHTLGQIMFPNFC